MSTRWIRTAAPIVRRAQAIAADEGARRIQPLHLAIALTTGSSDPRSASRTKSPRLSGEARAVMLAAWTDGEVSPKDVASSLAQVLLTVPEVGGDVGAALIPIASGRSGTTRWQDHLYPDHRPYPMAARSRLLWLGRFGQVRYVRRMDRVFDP